MVDVNDLWIGDILKVKSTGNQGKFLGLSSDGRVRLLKFDKIVLVKAKNLELVPEAQHNEKLKLLKEEKLKGSLEIVTLDKSIDLHIEKLKPHLKNALPERIVDFQIKAFENYINEVVNRKMAFVTIIHGKGLGVLRSHISAYLQSMEEVSHYHLVNNDGATEVFFKY